MSEIKVNKISPRTACGTTTLGDSGDTFTIPSGVTITNNGTANGFGATGAVNWQTTVKTTTFTAVAGEGYFVDTSSGSGFNVNLPAGVAGAVVGFKDYAGTFPAKNLTLVPNGSDKIGGDTSNVPLTQEGLAVTLVFIDSTKGWLVTDSGLQSEAQAPKYVAATGGNAVVTCGNHKIHIFTGPGTFCVSCSGNPQGVDTVDYLVVAGGGGGGGTEGGAGGGAGGFRASGGTASGNYTVSPLSSSPAPVAALPVSVQGYSIAVGGGGTAGSSPPSAIVGGNGVNSTFSTITSAGGGGGGPGDNCNSTPAGSGGSGGGAGSNSPSSSFGAGNTPPVSPSQGNPGGSVSSPTPNANGSGGGGGAGATGGDGKSPGGGDGGIGSYSAITTSTCYGTPGPVGSVRYYAGGGGSGLYGPGPIGAGGNGGGGDGARNQGPSAAGNGTTNTGGGGGGAGPNPGSSPNGLAGTGGSGIVIIRYKFQGS